MANLWFRIAALFMAAGIALGAFGAHALKGRLSPEALQLYHVAEFYQFVHAGGLFIVAWVLTQNPAAAHARLAGFAFISGILIFSGSLYLLSITGARWLGALTPVGGLFFIAGWLSLAIGG